jgi:deoxycytidine triphosphate deaminase
MLISPKVAIEQGWVTGIKDPAKQIQPNAIDFTLDRMFRINGENTFIISTNEETGKEEKIMRASLEVKPAQERGPNGKSWFYIDGNSAVDILSDMHVNLPEGVAALTIIRSTFCRNGLFLTSGLYDSGFNGHVGCIVHNRSGLAKIEVGTRIGQIMFVKAEAAGLYAGQWNHNVGTNAGHQQ